MSQSLSQLWTHIVFSTKNREPYLASDNLRDRLYQYIGSICHHHQSEIKSIGGVADHVHILLNLHKGIALTSLIREIKTSSTIWINKTNPSMRFSWQKGYGAFSVSESNLKAVIDYIKNQKSHHRKMNFDDELVKLLKKHNVDFNPDYL